MCDYSLCGVPNRLAVEGEVLITHRFPTGSMGLASLPAITAKTHPPKEQQLPRKSFWATVKQWLCPPESDPVMAVCVPPGAKLQMSRTPDALRKQFTLDTEEEVTFTQLDADAFHYRDAIRFRTGRHLLLQSFREGVVFQVLRNVSSDDPVVVFEQRGANSQMRTGSVRSFT